MRRTALRSSLEAITMGIPLDIVIRAAASLVAIPPLDIELPFVVELASITSVIVATSGIRRASGFLRGSAS